MTRTIWMAGCVLCALGAIAVGARRAESGAADALVRLQATTPGVQQVGNAHLSGTIKAGIFSGSGSGLSAVPWAAITGAPSTLLTLPYIGSGSVGVGGPVFSIQNTASGYGIRGVSNPASGTDGAGVYGWALGNGGYGVLGLANNASGPSIGVFGITASTDDYASGVYGQGPTNGIRGLSTAAGTGVFGESDGAGGYGVTGYSAGTSGSGIGVFAQSDSTSGYGMWAASQNVGVQAQAPKIGLRAVGFGSTSTTGVDASVSATDANSVAVKGMATSPALAGYFIGDVRITGHVGIGTPPSSAAIAWVFGNTPDAMLVTNYGSGRGIHVSTVSDTAGWFEASEGFASIDARNYGAGGTVGIYGTVSSGTGTAIWSNGNFVASGSKTFRIDHPLDPEHQFLLHYCTEGPVPQNAYNGIVTTDAKGEAWVQLPDYFESINKDFRYTLTVVEDTDTDQFVQAKVSRKIADGRFKIRTSMPNVEVSWEVKATRNDRWMQKYGAPVEVDKSAHEIGKYQRPELYDLPAERGIDFRPPTARR